jgi:lysophospholipid acyltransferase (LPLAT)-like uncharacterized protein
MSRKKRLLKHPYAQKVLAGIVAFYIFLVFKTSRISNHIDKDAAPYLDGKDNAIYAFWHGRMMMMPALCMHHTRKMRVLISLHHDGLLISQAVHHFGVGTIRGSTSRRSKGAMIEILRALRAGDNIGITPDGPRGPIYIAAPGATALAKISKKAIVPITFSSTRSRRFKSWDRFMVALPFGRVAFFAGSPIVVPVDADEDQLEAYRKQLESAMNQLTSQADSVTHAQ